MALMAIFSTSFFLNISRSFRGFREKGWEIKTLTVSAKNRIQNMSILMEGKAPQSLGGCQYVKTLRYSKACGSQNIRVHQSPPEASWDCPAHPQFPIRVRSGGGKYVLLPVVEEPQHPCSKHLPFSSSCLLISGLCQDCFPWPTSSGSASFFNTVLEKFLFQKLGNFRVYHVYLQWQENFSFWP